MGSYGQYMEKTSNYTVCINRGDSYDLSLDINKLLGDKYSFQGADIVYFGLMDPHQIFELALVKKRYTLEDLTEEGLLLIKILPEDTVDLMPGKYYYSVKIRLDHEDESGKSIEGVKTLIQKTKFIICD